MTPTIELHDAIRCGDAADLDVTQLYEAQRDLTRADPIHRRTWELLTDAQRETVMRNGPIFKRDAAELEKEAKGLLAELGIEPARHYARGARLSVGQEVAPHGHSRRRRAESGLPGEVQAVAPDEGRRVTPRRRVAGSAQLYDQFAERLVAARTPLEWFLVCDDLEKVLGLKPAHPRRFTIEATYGKRTVTVRLSPVQARRYGTKIMAAAEMRAAGDALRDIASSTGIPRSTLGDILDAVDAG